ncbi:MarR family winged helix-turn-helix transcriptional regulator [Furfurilactobacillus entadae]|uniref:MarR family winged helix-turn-helix transcriptional regulator n=1 Tax=Furfurilactobacillus entadae TaxID=2922307 RepID=UPI0035E9A958
MNNKELMDQYNNAFLFMGKFLDEFVSVVDQQYNLSHNAWLVMKLIRDHQKLTNQKIAEITKVAPASISAQISPLLKRGLVKQDTNDSDRRVKYLSLTESGLHIVNMIEMEHLKRFNQWVNDLGYEETIQLLKLIQKFETDVLPNDNFVNVNRLR